MIVIGLTGGMGSGKSTVAGMLREKGAQVIEADQVGHEVYRPGSEGWREVVEAFGQGVVGPDGAIDRGRLARLVFSDAEALRRLNAITHPRIKTALAGRLAELQRAGTAVAVVEAALLIEASWADLVDQVWLTVAPQEVAVQRVVAGSGLGRPQVEARLRAQLSDEERRRRAHVVIDNGGSLEGLQQRVDEVWAQLSQGDGMPELSRLS